MKYFIFTRKFAFGSICEANFLVFNQKFYMLLLNDNYKMTQIKNNIAELTKGEIVKAELRHYGSLDTIKMELVYLHTERIGTTERFVWDYLVGQKSGKMVEYCLFRLHSDVKEGLVKCNQFMETPIDPNDKGYSKKKKL